MKLKSLSESMEKETVKWCGNTYTIWLVHRVSEIVELSKDINWMLRGPDGATQMAPVLYVFNRDGSVYVVGTQHFYSGGHGAFFDPGGIKQVKGDPLEHGDDIDLSDLSTDDALPDVDKFEDSRTVRPTLEFVRDLKAFELDTGERGWLRVLRAYDGSV